jgi:cbb3-type cytochrome oxidase subunit 3
MEILLWLRAHMVALMVVVFGLIALTTYWPGRKSVVERNASIPLDDDL